MVRSALYFPHTEVRSESVIRSALLTWDNLEYIAPFKGYHPYYEDPSVAKAVELIGVARTPTEAEQDRVHELVLDILQEGIPEIFRYAPAKPYEPRYSIWPQKFAPRTWELLEEHGLTGDRGNSHYPTSEAAALALMAILADVLAGTTRARITDRGRSYAAIANATTTTHLVEEAGRVVPLLFKGIALEHVSIDRLIAFREREKKEGGTNYRTLRHNYLDAVDAHVARISKVPVGSSDRRELDRAFISDMEDDLADLKTELGFSKKDAFLSKDVITLVLAGGTLLAAAAAGAFSIPAPLLGTGGLSVLGGVLGARNKLAKARYEILRRHPTAYLYQVDS